MPEAKPTGWMIEGEWSGYRSGQRRVTHREYVRDAALAEKVRALGSIGYTDGTRLDLCVTPHRGKKALPAILGYSQLIRDCVRLGVRSVHALQEAEKSARDARSARLDTTAPPFGGPP